MKTVWRIVSALFMICTTIIIILSIVAIVGLWIGYTPATEAISDTLRAGETLAQDTQLALEDADELLGETKEQVQQVQESVTTVQADLLAFNPIIDTVSFLTSRDIEPILDRVWSVLLSSQQVFESIQQLVTALDTMLSIPPAVTQWFTDISDWTGGIVESGQAAMDSVNNFTRPISTQVIQPVLDTTAEFNQNIEQAQTQVAEVGQNLQTVRAEIAALIPQIPGYVTWTWSALTFLLVWLLLSQLLLFYLAWMLFHTGSLQALRPSKPSAERA